MQNAVVNVNGEIMEAASAHVSVFDRGFLYGDGLYEVVRTYGGDFMFALDEHLARLEKSLVLCRMKLAKPTAFYRQEMLRTLGAFRKRPGMQQTEAYVRIVFTRGVGRIGFGHSQIDHPTQYVIIAQPLDLPTEEKLRKGYHYRVVERARNHPRALDPAMKSGNYLNNLLAFLEATEPQHGFGGTSDTDDALLCDQEGNVTEGTTFNIFYIKRGIVVTAPLDIGILDGITRRITLDLCETLGIPVREVRFPKARLSEADEVFMTSSIKEVFPVTKIDGRPVADGKPGAMTMRLRAAFGQHVERAMAKAGGRGRFSASA